MRGTNEKGFVGKKIYAGYFFLPIILLCIRKSCPNRQSDADTAIGTVASPLSGDETVCPTILISNMYIPYADLRKIFEKHMDVCCLFLPIESLQPDAHEKTVDDNGTMR